MSAALVAPEARCSVCDDAGTIVARARSGECGPFSRPDERLIPCPLRCEAYREEMRLRDRAQARAGR